MRFSAQKAYTHVRAHPELHRREELEEMAAVLASRAGHNSLQSLACAARLKVPELFRRNHVEAKRCLALLEKLLERAVILKEKGITAGCAVRCSDNGETYVVSSITRTQSVALVGRSGTFNPKNLEAV